MKHWWKRAVYACILCLCLCCTACSANSQPDPAVLLRETLSQVNALESCESRFSNDLEFNAGTEQQTFHSAVSSVYFADPFCLKSTQDTGAGAPSVTYTMTEDGFCWFYAETEDGWLRTPAETLNTTPSEQIEILRLLKQATDPQFVREEEVEGTPAYKLEVTFPADILRSSIEAIVSASGMGDGSQTLVQELLASTPAVYGYCYIGKDDGRLLRMELDTTEALNTVFSKISGDSVKVSISKSVLTGELFNCNAAAPVELPPEAASAQTVEDAG